MTSINIHITKNLDKVTLIEVQNKINIDEIRKNKTKPKVQKILRRSTRSDRRVLVRDAQHFHSVDCTEDQIEITNSDVLFQCT